MTNDGRRLHPTNHLSQHDLIQLRQTAGMLPPGSAAVVNREQLLQMIGELERRRRLGDG